MKQYDPGAYLEMHDRADALVVIDELVDALHYCKSRTQLGTVKFVCNQAIASVKAFKGVK